MEDIHSKLHHSKVQRKISREKLLDEKSRHLSGTEKENFLKMMDQVKVIDIESLTEKMADPKAPEIFKENAQNLLDLLEFCDSKFWRQMKKTKMGHNLGYSMFQEQLGSDQV